MVKVDKTRLKWKLWMHPEILMRSPVNKVKHGRPNDDETKANSVPGKYCEVMCRDITQKPFDTEVGGNEGR